MGDDFVFDHLHDALLVACLNFLVGLGKVEDFLADTLDQHIRGLRLGQHRATGQRQQGKQPYYDFFHGLHQVGRG